MFSDAYKNKGQDKKFLLFLEEIIFASASSLFHYLFWYVFIIGSTQSSRRDCRFEFENNVIKKLLLINLTLIFFNKKINKI